MPSACPRCGRSVATSARRCPSCDKVLRSPVQLATPRPTELPRITRPQPPRTKAEVRTEAAVEKTRAGVRVGLKAWRWLPRRAKFVVAGVIVALVVGVPATIWIVGKVAYAPEEPVEDLVAAFNDGDLARAAELAGCTSRLCRESALSAGYRAPENMEIAEVAMGGSTNPDSADVIVRYDLAGQRQESIIRVSREPGVLPKGWSIRSGAVGNLEIAASSVRSVRIAALDVQPTAGGREPALIGRYEVRVGADDPLYEGEPVPATIKGDLRTRPVTSVKLTTAVRQSARDEIGTQVRAFLDKCAASDAQKPRVDGRTCPFSYTGYFPPGSSAVSWQLDPLPVFEVVVPEKAREGVALEVRTTTPGSATFRYTFRESPYQAEAVAVSVKGEVRLDNGKIQFLPT
jgi:hypothetical protein